MSNCESSPCQLSTHSSLLRPVAQWCLDTFGDDAPMLIGVAMGPDKVSFHPVQLSCDDPLTDLAGLAAPIDWDVVVAVVPTRDVDAPYGDGILAHSADRHGASATEIDDWCGHRRPLRSARGRLHALCELMFDHPGEYPNQVDDVG